MSKYRNNEIERLAGMFKALSNPQRLRIFLRLAGCCAPRTCPAPLARNAGSAVQTICCVGELGAELDLAASTVSHHLKELRHSGLMKVERHGRRIDCWIPRETLRQLAAFFAGDTEPDARRRRSRGKV